jgi:hypothetical protein
MICLKYDMYAREKPSTNLIRRGFHCGGEPFRITPKKSPLFMVWFTVTSITYTS